MLKHGGGSIMQWGCVSSTETMKMLWTFSDILKEKINWFPSVRAQSWEFLSFIFFFAVLPSALALLSSTQVSYHPYRKRGEKRKKAVHQNVREDIWRTVHKNYLNRFTVVNTHLYLNSPSAAVKGECESSEGFGRKDMIAFMSHQAVSWIQAKKKKENLNISVFRRQLTSVCLWIYDFQTIWEGGEIKKGVSRQSQWLITKADRDGRQTLTHACG